MTFQNYTIYVVIYMYFLTCSRKALEPILTKQKVCFVKTGAQDIILFFLKPGQMMFCACIDIQ